MEDRVAVDRLMRVDVGIAEGPARDDLSPFHERERAARDFFRARGSNETVGSRSETARCARRGRDGARDNRNGGEQGDRPHCPARLRISENTRSTSAIRSLPGEGLP